MEKLGLETNAELIAYALDRGLTESSPPRNIPTDR
jgi:hypothetical protein